MKQGVLVFAVARAEDLKVVISAGQGHTKELRIPARELEAKLPPVLDVQKMQLDQLAGDRKQERDREPQVRLPRPAPTDGEAGARRERGTGLDVPALVAGIALLLALGAFVISIRNARELRRLRQLNLPEAQPVRPDEHAHAVFVQRARVRAKLKARYGRV